MRRPRPVQAPQEPVASWPRVAASVRPDGTGTLTVNGTERPVAADDVEHLRSGVIARAAALANRLHRPVRLTVTEEPATWTLAVRPSGVVQLLSGDGTVPTAEGLHPHHGPCRQCGAEQPVTALTCPACTAEEPHRVDVVLGGRASVDLVPTGSTRPGKTHPHEPTKEGRNVQHNA